MATQSGFKMIIKKLLALDINGALLRYRILAYMVGVGLFILVFIGIPLQIWAHSEVIVKIVGPIHGVLYIIYLLSAADLWVRAKYKIGRVIATILAGFVPIAAFVVEYYTTKFVKTNCLTPRTSA
jgi:integral membrane protein